jgi:hypothetical protein
MSSKIDAHHVRVGLRARGVSQYEQVIRSHDGSHVLKAQADLMTNDPSKDRAGRLIAQI